jgi:hypothetical protein
MYILIRCFDHVERGERVSPLSAVHRLLLRVVRVVCTIWDAAGAAYALPATVAASVPLSLRFALLFLFIVLFLRCLLLLRGQGDTDSVSSLLPDGRRTGRLSSMFLFFLFHLTELL